MGKRQRTPHFITGGLGTGVTGHVRREKSNQESQKEAHGNLVGFHHPALGNKAAGTDDIFQVTKHTRRNNPHHSRLRPVANERLARLEMMDEGRDNRWDMVFSSSSDGANKESAFANPMRSGEQWQMSAMALVGMIVLLSALFLHLVSESSSSTSGGSSQHNHANPNYPRRNSIARAKRKSSGTTRKKKKFDVYSSDEASEGVDDGLSDGQASTATPNNGAPVAAATTNLFYPYQASTRHRKPSVNGYKETYAGAAYSPSAAGATSGFQSRNYYLAPTEGPVMMPTNHYPAPSSSLKVRLASPQASPAQQPQKPQHQELVDPQRGNNKAEWTPQRRALDAQFVATGLESFQSDPPQAEKTPLPQEGVPQQEQQSTPVVDNDEESQHPPMSESSNMSPLTSTCTSQPPSPAVAATNLVNHNSNHNHNRAPSYSLMHTSTDSAYMAYNQVSDKWDSIGSSNSNSNNEKRLNDSTHHMSNVQGTHQKRNSGGSSTGMLSPRMEISFADLETPKAGLTRRTVDVMAGSPGAVSSPYYSKWSAQKRPSQSRSRTSSNSNDPFYPLRLPETNAMGMSPPRPNRQGGLNISFSPSNPNQYSSSNGQLQVQQSSSKQQQIPMLPKLHPTGADTVSVEQISSAGERSSLAAPRSISVDELRLEQMEFGSVPHWHVRDPSPSDSGNPAPEKGSAPLGSSSDLFTNVSMPSTEDFSEVTPVETNEARKSIKHKRPNITIDTDATSSLQSSIKFSELKLEEVIGGGGFGQVWRAKWRGTPVAVKVLTGSAQAKHVSKAILEEFAAEINLLSGMRHPNICLYMGACVDPPNRAIITELAANGSLWDALRLPVNPPFSACDGFSRHFWPGHLYFPGKHGTPPTSAGVSMPPVAPVGSWPWVLVKHVACGAARGMAYLHSGDPPILHRDLKSANILLNESYTAKVCDFGLSRLKAQERSMTGNCGTVQWMSPEVLANQRYNEKADVYSYGIICTELLTRECPYEGMSAIQCALAVLNRDQRPDIPKFCPPQLRALIKACVKKNPDERPTFSQIISALDTMP